ncbi:MAG: MBL fold metallo-hydrolase [Candidatus Wallbacteria bacterium]|nr:MBL fold metallo-hydrolase [Candidatus Wallbacteria bacterium]
MHVKFWGVRGSIPAPGPETSRYGGNTSCVEVSIEDEVLVFDSGTGIRKLGLDLIKRGKKPIAVSIFISHTHWDHIQGFPFFTPVFMPGNAFQLYGGKTFSASLEECLDGQMQHPNFPVMLRQLPSTLRFHNLQEGESLTIDLNPEISNDPIHVTFERLFHPNGVFSYRVDYKGKSIVYATDNEPGGPEFDRRLVKIAQGADVLIFDAQYTPEEYPSKKGWGHSTWLDGVKVAKRAGVKQLVLFHHDPERSDDELDSIEAQARAQFAGTVAAYEGMELNL